MSLFLRLLLGGLLVFSLAACAPGGEDENTDGDGASVSQQDGDSDDENDDD
ncbi:hypothetical protein [Deinococcus sp. NW-56]|uniref:hypothetical protein n=1 Tax=Deinococcus sp. NW-56 TaxID=2080419 RepID=UPI001319BACA|nr:hypothetical protein [Deinococcus sp. NW-56]